MPQKSVQYQISSKKTVACAKLFDKLIAIVIDVLICNIN